MKLPRQEALSSDCVSVSWHFGDSLIIRLTEFHADFFIEKVDPLCTSEYQKPKMCRYFESAFKVPALLQTFDGALTLYSKLATPAPKSTETRKSLQNRNRIGCLFSQIKQQRRVPLVKVHNSDTKFTRFLESVVMRVSGALEESRENLYLIGDLIPF